MKVTAVFLSVAAAFSISGMALAADMASDNAAAVTEQAAPVNAGNKVCPVLGNPIPADSIGVNTVEYNGKLYNLCCPMCKEKFLSDAEKYSKIAEDEVAGVVAAASDVK